jgi:hypothetical protein
MTDQKTAARGGTAKASFDRRLASSATAASFGQRASTSGMHHLAWIMLGAGLIYLLITVVDRSLRRPRHPRRRNLSPS